MTNDIATIAAALARADTEGFSPELEQVFLDHLPALLDRVAALEAALRPFAAVAGIQRPISADWPDDKPNKDFIPSAWPDWGDFRRARTTLTGERS